MFAAPIFAEFSFSPAPTNCLWVSENKCHNNTPTFSLCRKKLYVVFYDVSVWTDVYPMTSPIQLFLATKFFVALFNIKCNIQMIILLVALFRYHQ